MARVLEIIFARPDKKNALSNAMYRAATEALDEAQKNQGIRAVLFAAERDALPPETTLPTLPAPQPERARGSQLIASSKH